MSVLWDSEMSLCIGLTTEMNRNEFIEQALKEYKRLTGEMLFRNQYAINISYHDCIWILKVII